MTMLRRVLAIVTRSFYRNNSHRVKLINRYGTKAHHHRQHHALYPTSTRLLTYHYHKYTTSAKPNPSIRMETKTKSKSSFKKQLKFIAAATTLSYIGYKYYFYDDKHEQDSNSLPRAIFKTAAEIIENKILHSNFAFKMGLFMDNRNRYDKALYFYKLYLRKPNTKPGEYAALNNMCIIYYKLAEYDNALIAFELLGTQQTRERNLEFIRAHCYHILKQYDNALIYYHKFLANQRSKQADILSAYNNLALLYYELGQYEKALQYFKRMGDEAIKEKNYGFRVAHSLQHTDEFEKALTYYNLYLANPDTSNVNLENTYHNLGVLFYDNGKDKQAMEMFNKLGEEEIRKRNLEFKMAHVCARLDDKRGAVKYLKDCKNKPDVYGEYAIVCQGIMAQILYEIGEYDQAMHEFDKLGQEEIIKLDLCFPAAFSYFKGDRYGTALIFFRLLIENKRHKWPRSELAFIYSRICLIHYKQKHFAKVLEMIADELSEEFVIKYNMEFIAGHCNHKLHRYDKAQAYYHKFLANDKSEPADIINCYQNLALLYYDLNNFSKGMQYFALMAEDEILERGLEFYIGRCLQETQRYKECIKYYTLFLQKLDQNKSEDINDSTLQLMNQHNVYHNLGNVYYALGEWHNACKTWNNLTDTDISRLNLAVKLSKCYAMMGDAENEAKYSSLATERNETGKEQINVAKMYYIMYENEKAIQMFEQVDDADIVGCNAEFVLAHCYQLVGNQEQAIKYYKMGLQNANLKDMDMDGITNAYHNLGCAYHDMGDYEKAVGYFDKLSNEHIIKTNVEFIIGVCYHNLSDDANALKYYKMFLLNPAHKSKGKGGESELADENIISCYNNMVILYYHRLKDYENAWQVLMKMGNGNIKAKKLEFESAHCAQELNKNQISLKYYQSFLRNTPTNELSDELVSSIYKNVVIMYRKDSNLDENIFQQFREKAGNKHQELRMFLEWINKANDT